MSMRTGSRVTLASRCCAAAGVVGSLACSISMALAAFGLAGTALSAGGSMAGMQGTGSGASTASKPSLPVGVIAFLVQAGPVILVISVAAIMVAFGLRRRVAVIPALAFGVLMYWGMYLQPRLEIMYAAIGLGLLGWAALYLWSRGWQLRAQGG